MSTPHVRPSTSEATAALAHSCIRACYIESVLTQYKPQLCTFPTHTCTWHSRDNKGWTDSMQQPNILFICTETWWQRWTSSSPDRCIRLAVEREEEQPQQWSSPSPDRYTRSAAERGRTGDQALPPTYTLDWWQKEDGPTAGKLRSVHSWSVSGRIGTATERDSRAYTRFFYGSNPRRRRSQESSRGPWTLRIYTPKDLREYVLCY